MEVFICLLIGTLCIKSYLMLTLLATETILRSHPHSNKKFTRCNYYNIRSGNSYIEGE